MRSSILLIAALCAASAAGAQSGDWPAYGNDPGASRWSPLARIDRANVHELRQAWVYRTGDARAPNGKPVEASFEATPLYVDGTLFLDTPIGRVIALDPEHGRPRWTFDPHVDVTKGFGDFTSRGVSTWLDTMRAPGAACRRRIFVAPIDARLIALDAATGRPCADFGRDGTVDLRAGVRNGIAYYSQYEETSPPAVIDGLVIVGSGIADNYAVNEPSGVVRAYDARTGALRWSWDPVPQDSADPAWRTWRGPKAHTTGAANAWSVITTDPERHLVFVPTGAPSPDYYGGERLGDDRYANSVTALRASTGAVVWSFQVVHHDLWDYDVPSPPTLVTVHRDGKAIPAVVVSTKMGHLFVLDRDTGKPLFPVEERAVPQTDVPGEATSPTQPFPVLPKPLVPEHLSASEAWGLTASDRAWCRTAIASLRNEGIFTPPSLRGTLAVPGNIGGSNWGGVSVDRAHGLLIVPTNRVPAVVRLIPRDRYDAERDSIHEGEFAAMRGTPYGMWRTFLLSPSRLPCSPPPWGALTAIDLATGAVKWEVPLGEFPWAPRGSHLEHDGTINLGGSVVTAGGLVFIGATLDPHFRAFDVETGKLLWTADLPVAATATPMTFRAPDGKQYVVIAAGGHARTGLPVGDYVIAYALP